MAFPYVFESNFERGDNSDWDSENDNENIIDFPHYTELARFGLTPYSGAYCMRAVMAASGTADAVVIEGDLNVAVGATRQVSFWCYLGSDLLDNTVVDVINIFELQSASNNIETRVGINVPVGGPLNFRLSVAAGSNNGAALEADHWYLLEIDVTLDSGGSNDGTLTLYVTRDDQPISSSSNYLAIDTLDQDEVLRGVLGIQNRKDTTSGTVLFDDFVFDEGSRTQREIHRWSKTRRLTQSGHIFVGPGKIDNVTLVTRGTGDQSLRLWDTDRARVPVFGSPLVEMHQVGTTDSEIIDPAGVPIRVSKGAYIEMTGSDPSAIMEVSWASAWGSPSNVVRHGLRSS